MAELGQLMTTRELIGWVAYYRYAKGRRDQRTNLQVLKDKMRRTMRRGRRGSKSQS